ncbi:hypothetical protein CWS02_06295 [Enterobacter sp. EA-1]|nr:hypothetical protein CWS02_06295 [Enterobacter sp. EA-1]
MIADEVTNITVPGLLLEAAVQVDNTRYLLFLTDDVIFEESLTIVLIDIRHGVKEVVRIGQMWATGILRMYQLARSRSIFIFWGEGGVGCRNIFSAASETALLFRSCGRTTCTRMAKNISLSLT